MNEDFEQMKKPEYFYKIQNWNDNFNIRKYCEFKPDTSEQEEYLGYALITSNQAINILTGGKGDLTHEIAGLAVGAAVLNIELPNYILDGTNLEDLKEYEKEYKEIVSFLHSSIQIKMEKRSTPRLFIIMPSKITQSQFEVFKKYIEKISMELTGTSSKPNLYNFLGDNYTTNDSYEVIKHAEKRIDYNKKDILDTNLIGFPYNNYKPPKKRF